MKHILLLMTLVLVLLSGCSRLPADAPTLADERRPDLANKMGLGVEYEVIKRIEVSDAEDRYLLRARNQYGPIGGTHVGYLEPGTRIRTQHVWFSPPEEGIGIASWVTTSMRVVPSHPFPLALFPADLPGSWDTALTGDRVNAYMLPASHARVVDEHERTPEDQIVPLTERQEWPKWRRR